MPSRKNRHLKDRPQSFGNVTPIRGSEAMTQEDMLKFFVISFKESPAKAAQLKNYFLKQAVTLQDQELINSLYNMIKEDYKNGQTNWRWKYTQDDI